MGEAARGAEQLAERIADNERRLIEEGRQLLEVLSHLDALATGDAPQCSTLLGHVREHFPRYADLGLADRDGNVLCRARESGPKSIVATRDLREVLTRGGFVVGEYELTEEGLPTVPLAYSAGDEPGELSGVLYALLDLRAAAAPEEEVIESLPEGSSVILAEAGGKVISRRPGGVPGPDDRVAQRLVEQGALGASSGFLLDDDGPARLVAFAPVLSPFSGDGGWHVLVSSPAEVVLHDAESLLLRNLLGLVLVLLTAGAGTRIVSLRYVLRPVQTLLRMARRMADGDLQEAVGPPYPGGELGDLGRAFDQMAASLRRREAERERTLEEMSRSEAEQRSLVDGAPFGILRTSPEGRILRANPTLVEMLGYDSEQDLRAVSMNEIYVDPEERRQRIDLEGHPHADRVRLQWQRKDGSIVVVRVVGRSIVDEEGRLTGYESMVEDVTERRDLERQLLQAQKMEAVGRLAGGMAHDFNNQLTGVLGFAELALERVEDDPEAQADLEEVQRAASRAAELAKRLLTFGRQQPIAVKAVELDHLVEGTLKMIERLIEESIEVRFFPGVPGACVRVDPGQIEQVLLNLAINARDAMPDGGAFEISTEEEVREASDSLVSGSYLVLEVRDTGHGMDAATLDKIFDPFFTTKEEGKGTGLGLATAYGIVGAHGGEIRVWSELGEGTRFRVYLPRVAAEEEGALVRGAVSQQLRGEGTILLVDDNEVVRQVIARTLRGAGYSVLSSRSSDEARELFATCGEEIDLLLTDIVMPGESGRELFRRLSRSAPGLRVLFMSGYAGAGRLGEVPAENEPFIQKPFSPSSLLATVHDVLERGRDQRLEPDARRS